MEATGGGGEIRVPWQSSITEVRPNELRTHGVDQRTIIREFSFEETVFLLLRGRRPDAVERTMLRAVLVSVASHGITGQSTMAVVAAADCPSDFLHALVAGFSVGAGSVHLGATAAAMVDLQRLASLTESELDRHVEERLAADQPMTGFGHRFHSEDPRANEILELARESGFDGPHLTVARRVQVILRERKGLALNIAGANAAILLDLGFDPRIAQLFIVLGRSPMFAAVYLERLAQGRDPFQLIEVFDVLPAERARGEEPADEAGERRVPWQTSITEVHTNELRTRGIDQRTIVREFSFEEMVFLLLAGRRPDPVERTMLRALLVSFASHGITGQSTIAVVAAADCPSDFLHALVGGFSAGAGSVHQGAMGAAMVELQRLAILGDQDVERYVEDRLAKDERFTGYGHRFHGEDPRARALLELAEEAGFAGPYLTVARRVEEILHARKGIALNISGAGAAILLDLGFDPRIAHLFVVLGRSAMFAAVYLERLEQGRDPFQRIEVVDVLPAG